MWISHLEALAVVVVVAALGVFFLVPVASFATYEPNMVCYGLYGVCWKPSYVSLSCELSSVGIAWVAGSPSTYNGDTGTWGGWHFQVGCPPAYPPHT